MSNETSSKVPKNSIIQIIVKITYGGSLPQKDALNLTNLAKPLT